MARWTDGGLEGRTWHGGTEGSIEGGTWHGRTEGGTWHGWNPGCYRGWYVVPLYTRHILKN